MQNTVYNQKGEYIVQTFDSSGNLVLEQKFNSSGQSITRNQTSTSGAKPKPLVPNNYHLNCGTSTAVQSSFRQQNGNGSFILASGPVLHAASSGWGLQPTYDKTSLYNKALSKLAEQVRGDLDISIDLAEAGKTAKMLKLTTEAVEYTKTFVNKFGLIKVGSKAWLTYQYGVRPLLKSIFGLADENLRHVLNGSQRYFVRVSEVYVPSTISWTHCLGGVVSSPVINSNCKVSITIGVDIRTDQFDLARFSSLNPVSIAWELTPLSFVADWFFNIGGYLRNLETYLLYAGKFRSGYVTTLSAGTVFGVNRSTKPPGQFVGTDAYLQFNGKYLDIRREVLTSYPAPTLPQLRAELGSSRLISAAALLGQLLKGR